MIIDTHIHLIKPFDSKGKRQVYTPNPASAEDYVALMDKYSINHAFFISWSPEDIPSDLHVKGIRFESVQETMNCDYAIIIDLTHIRQKAFDEVFSLTKHPVIISHCAVSAISADLSDEKIKAIAQNEGVLGLHFYWTYMAKRFPDGKIADDISVSDLVDHVDYITDLVGIDYVGLGADFFPIQHVKG